MVAVPVADPDFAVIVTVPGNRPDTVPFDETPAISALPLLHVTGAVMIAPDGSRTVAVSDTVPSTLIVAVAGVTVTVRTPAPDTVTVGVAVLPSLVAGIVAVPPDTPESS